MHDQAEPVHNGKSILDGYEKARASFRPSHLHQPGRCSPLDEAINDDIPAGPLPDGYVPFPGDRNLLTVCGDFVDWTNAAHVISFVRALAAPRPATAGDTLAALRRASIARQIEWGGGAREPLPVLFKATELGGEAGEVLNVVKKLERERLGWDGSRATVGQLADELADLVICADLLAEAYAIDLPAAIVRKFDATSAQRGLRTRMGRPDALADLVSRFAVALIAKLRAAEAKHGHGDAWSRPDWQDDLCRQLAGHVAKGDPLDVAAYAAFAWHHGWPVSAAAAAPHWRHVARGTVYEEVGRAELQSSDPSTDPCEGDRLVVYRGRDGRLWARGEAEFEDGRFVRVEAEIPHG